MILAYNSTSISKKELLVLCYQGIKSPEAKQKEEPFASLSSLRNYRHVSATKYPF
jgi:hypothetical protein